MPKLSLFIAVTTILCLPAVIWGQPPVRSGYQFEWSDEFSTTSVDLSKWIPSNTNNTTNNSLQDYLPQQVDVAGGNLVITSENVPSRGLPYRSGLVTSTTKQKYGRWDVRAKLPATTGMWPAIWLLADEPWPSGGEIDIMENRGTEPNTVSSAFHYGTNPPFSHSFKYSAQEAVHDGALVNYHDSFHTYSVEWDPEQLRFYVDDVHYWTVTDSDVGGFLTNGVDDMRLIINTAVGGDFLENPNASTVWPQQMAVDYVHVYSKLATDRVLEFDNGGFESGGGSMAQWAVFGRSRTTPNVSSGNEFVNAGSESLKLYGQFNGENNFSGVTQGISVVPGDELMASVDAFVSSQDSIAGTNNDAILKIDYFSEQFGLFGSSTYLGSDDVLIANNTTVNNQWINRQLTSTVPAGAVEARVVLVFAQRDNQGGAVHLDNVEFSVVVELLPGDANGNGMVNNLDIAAFALALFSRPAYQLMYPTLDPDAVLDMNGDEAFNNLDIAGFAAALGF